MHDPQTNVARPDFAAFAVLIDFVADANIVRFERKSLMAHLQEIVPMVDRSLAGAWLSELAQNTPKATRARVQPYRVTRSTLSLMAGDLLDMQDQELLETLLDTIKASTRLNREEIVLERLDQLDHLSIADAQSVLQGFVFKACSMLCLPEPRIALEKWSFGYDLRIYLARIA